MESATDAQPNAGAVGAERRHGSEGPLTHVAARGLRRGCPGAFGKCISSVFTPMAHWSEEVRGSCILPALMAAIAGTTTFTFVAESGAAKPKVPQNLVAPKLRVCHGTWSYSRHTVKATVKAPGPAGVRFVVRDSTGKMASASATIPVGRVSVSRSIGWPKPPTLVIATVVEHKADGSLRGIDLTCDLTRSTAR
jgi:hypothetical protein